MSISADNARARLLEVLAALEGRTAAAIVAAKKSAALRTSTRTRAAGAIPSASPAFVMSSPLTTRRTIQLRSLFNRPRRRLPKRRRRENRFQTISADGEKADSGFEAQP
eukprot:4053874-Pleurochrysis_carterae.AAC.1